MVKSFLEDTWDVEVFERDHYDPIDWEIYQHGELIGAVELKNYNRNAFDTPTVILNIRKFIALRDWNRDNELPALYMVNFWDEIRYIDIRRVNTSEPVMGGQKGGPRSTDWEPVYMVPVADMKLLAKKGN